MGTTKQRLAIFKIISESGLHMTADQVLEKARLVFPNIGRGTVYRNLNIMADEGVIRRVNIPGESVLFDHNIAPHQHMVCVRCGGVTDIGDIDRENMQKIIGPGAELVDCKLLVYAVCKDCAVKQ